MRKSVGSVVAILVAVTLLAACGGGGSSKSEDTIPLPTEPASSAAGLANLVAHAAQQRYKITYNDQSGEPQTYAQDGKGASVQMTNDTQTFLTKTSTVNCDRTATGFQCTRSPRSVAAGNPLFGVLSLGQAQQTALGSNLGSRSDETIAGRAAQCVTFAAKDLLGDTVTVPPALLTSKVSYSYCIDKATGVTLRVSGTDDAGKETTSLEVTKFETPTAADFVPPAAATPASAG